MHEFSMLKDLCDQVLRLAQNHRARGVLKIVVEAGDRMHGTPEHWQETFNIFRESIPVLSGAQLEIRRSSGLQGETMMLRDVELEVTEEEDEAGFP